jgi:hypothetical protein
MIGEDRHRSSGMAEDVVECRSELRIGITDEDQSLVCAARQDPTAAGRLYDKHYP